MLSKRTPVVLFLIVSLISSLTACFGSSSATTCQSDEDCPLEGYTCVYNDNNQENGFCRLEEDASSPNNTPSSNNSPNTPSEPGEDSNFPVTSSNTGCPDNDGLSLSGIVRVESLKNDHTMVPGPSADQPFCGTETCGEGKVMVLLCTTSDCSAPGDPVRTHVNNEGKLVQSSFDEEAFEFCGLSAGTYHVLPVIDHDENGLLSNFDYTMGNKSVDNLSENPIRVAGYPVDLTTSTALPTERAGSGELSPVVVNYYNYKHETPAVQTESGHLYTISTLHPDVAPDSLGIRAIDLSTYEERDFDTSNPNRPDAQILGTNADGAISNFNKVTTYGNTTFLSVPESGGLIMTITTDNGSVQQGQLIDLRGTESETELAQFAFEGAAGEHQGRDYLVVLSAEEGGAPYNPDFPISIIDITEISDSAVTEAKHYGEATPGFEMLEDVAFDQVRIENGMVFVTESGRRSQAQTDADENRLWVFPITENGELGVPTIYNNGAYAPVLHEECSAQNPYPRSGLWVGEFNGAIHAMAGGLHGVALWKFDGTPDSGTRVQRGEGFNASDLALDQYGSGFVDFRQSPDGSKLFAFPECKSRYSAEIDGDFLISRRRIAVFDLNTADNDGLPSLYQGYNDATWGADTVRRGLNEPSETLNEDSRLGIGFDCVAVSTEIIDVFGREVSGSLFGASCNANNVDDVVVTDHHIIISGRGSVDAGNTGLGNAGELMILDLETGREVLSPSWSWFYEGSSNQGSYGYFGHTLGSRFNTETTTGLILMK